MSNNQFNKRLLSNTLWSFFGRFGYISIGLISNIILVRLLSPTEFGQVSIIMFFIVVASILVDSGLSGALVRDQETSEVDYSTVFIFNFLISLFLMLLLIVSANTIANFYNDNELKSLLKFSSLLLLINALKITQSVKLIKDLKFKTKSIFEIISVVIGSIIAVYAAIQGAGAYAIVLLQLASAAVLTIILWCYVGPVKSFIFDKSSFRKFYNFGINTTLASLIDRVFDSSYQLILAKYFSISQSGYFYQAKKLQEVPISVIQGSVLGVIYATLSKLQENKEKFNKLYFNIVRFFSIIVAFICIIIFIYSEFIVSILYGREWLVSAMYLKLLIIASFFYLQEIFNRILFKIFNKTDLILKLEIVKKSILILTILFGIWTLSISNLLYGFVIASIVSFFINYHVARKIHTQPYWKELKIILKVILAATLTVISNQYIIYIFNLDSFYILITLPIIIFLYFFTLTLLRVIEFNNDFIMLKELVK